MQSAVAALILAVFILADADPYTVVFSFMSALAVIGILAVQALVSIAVIRFFRRTRTGHGVWTTLIAPALSLVGLVGALALVVSNLSLLTGSEGPVVAAFPYGIALVFLVGVGFALFIRRCRPDLYASLGEVFG